MQHETQPIETIVTDFGVVQLSPKTIAYLNRVAPDRAKPVKKRESRALRGQRAMAQRVVLAACTCAAIQFESGELLEVF